MSALKWIGCFLLFLQLNNPVLAADPDLGQIAKAYVQALEKTNQEVVSDADRDKLFDFYLDDIQFVHVKSGTVIESKETLRAGSEQFEGWNRNVTLNLTDMIVGENVVFIEVDRTGEQKDMDGNWNPSNFTFQMVLEFENGKIKKVMNY